MDLQEVWKKLETDKLEKPVLGSVEIRKKSKHPVQKLKTAYLQATGISVAALIMFGILFFRFHEPLVKIGLTAVIAGYIFFLVTNFSMYRKINVSLPVDQSLKTALLHTYNFITDNIRFQERTALFIYPVAATAGFMVGGSSGGGDVVRMMQDYRILIILIIVIIILTPLCYFLAKWMYRISYGKCLAELEGMIAELEKPD